MSKVSFWIGVISLSFKLKSTLFISSSLKLNKLPISENGAVIAFVIRFTNAFQTIAAIENSGSSTFPETGRFKSIVFELSSRSVIAKSKGKDTASLLSIFSPNSSFFNDNTIFCF